jgi:F-type H+-transporting ATPase subunit b
MYLVPTDIGPLNPKVEELAVALPLFAAVFFLIARVLPRINRVIAQREDAIQGAAERAEAVRLRAENERAKTEKVLSEARHDAARTRQRAAEEGAALIAAARQDGRRERDSIIEEGKARIEAERAAAETELRISVSELASNLASRIVGEPLPARTVVDRRG